MYQFADDCLIQKTIGPNKRVTIKQNANIPGSVSVYCFFSDNGGNDETRLFTVDFKDPIVFQSGSAGAKLTIFATMLSSPTSIGSAGTSFNVGVGAGDSDHEPFANANGTAAKVNITFTSDKAPIPALPVTAATTSVMMNVGFAETVNAADMKYFNTMDTMTLPTVQFQVANDGGSGLFIEEHTWIHVFDQSNRLICIVKRRDNEIVQNSIFRLAQANGFWYLPLIQINKEGGFFFDVGDPKRDADVEITEE